ncbi:excinuclease ABC subunit UvrA [Candidatus Gracilibacteria bacterium]|nr:excinuclease ABC subunit UvrA [Candidatus Gracilibacteria bacterium]
MASDKIIIHGARVHNLKNIDLELPRDQLIVMTGLSGSGKSSLAFDTIYAEGQRRYVESLSTYARQFLELMEKPDVDQIDGLSPAISIDQKSTSRNPRSTVGTVTEIYDYLRLLFAKVGQPHCPNCSRPVTKQTIQQITDQVANMAAGTKLMILAPLVKARKGEHVKVFDQIRKGGFVRMRVDGQVYNISDSLSLDKNQTHTIDVVVDRLIAKEKYEPEDMTRLADSIELALGLGEGMLAILDMTTSDETIFSEHFACVYCGISLPEISPRSFSFNSPHGACNACHGLGTKLEVDENLLIPNPRLTLAEGAIVPWAKTASRLSWYNRILKEVGKLYDFDLDVPYKDLSVEAKKIVLQGTGTESYHLKGVRDYNFEGNLKVTYEGVIPNLERRYNETDSDYVRKEIEKYMQILTCPDCGGQRLKKEILAVKIAEKSIIDVTALSVARVAEFFSSLPISDHQKLIAARIVKEITDRLSFLQNVGLNYLTLSRSASTLSGGEAQRIRLATQIGSQLQGVLYVLDEPSIGLHQRDNDRLITTLKRLRDLGNTVIVVEHDTDTMLASDYIVDIGPGAGKHGGQVISQGIPSFVMDDPKSLTGQYLSGRKLITIPAVRRKGNGKQITIHGATEHNLKDVTVSFPLGKFVAVTGVSGSGKSTLINEILVKSLTNFVNGSNKPTGAVGKITGFENIDKIISIDQKPIGRTPRSNPATYTGVFTDIRELFAATAEARTRGYKSGRFSFNVKGGRCETCHGDGIVRIEMHFLPDLYVPCEVCKGQRYNREALEIHYKAKNIAQVLDMTVEDAAQFFAAVPKIKEVLDTLLEVGLGYIKLGQQANTLSGGEAQRIKLATELARRSTGKTLYVLDEPTTGLHFADVERLLNVLNKLVENGNTVVTIEHNLDVIKCVDWVIDLGPEGGEGGGLVLAEGTPEAVMKAKGSYTGQYLKLQLDREHELVLQHQKKK